MSSEYSAEEVRALLKRTRRVLRDRPAVERVSPPIMAIGDIHGDMSSLGASIRLAEDEGVFPVILGDFIDRSPHNTNVEVAISVMELAASGRALVLRGNHENFLHFHLGPYLELAPDLLVRYGDYPDLLQDFGETFQGLSAVAVTESVLLTHAGIPTLPFKDIDPLDPEAMVPLTWADPEAKPAHGWHTFNEREVNEFMTASGRKVFIRGHTAPLNRIVVYDKALTLQTTEGVKDAGAGGINVAVIRDEVSTVEQLEVYSQDGRWHQVQPIHL
jgi:hypothetical protein